VKQDPSQEFILITAEGFRTSFERKDIPAATDVKNRFIVGGEKGFRSHGQICWAKKI
jgi:hypothetical protein